MTRTKRIIVLVALAVALFLAACLIAGEAAPVWTARHCYSALDTIAWDDDVPAVSISLLGLLPGRSGAEAQLTAFAEIFSERQPNDILLFEAARRLSVSLPAPRSAAVYRQYTSGITGSPVDDRYILVALLPLASRGGICHSRMKATNIATLYDEVGWPNILRETTAGQTKEAVFERLRMECR